VIVVPTENRQFSTREPFSDTLCCRINAGIRQTVFPALCETRIQKNPAGIVKKQITIKETGYAQYGNCQTNSGNFNI